MTVSKNSIQVEWAAADSKSVGAGGTETSDVATLSADAFQAGLQLKADHSSTPASGDTIDWYLLPTLGDPDADPDSVDEYDTIGHAYFLAQLDTNTEDPALISVEVPAWIKAFKLTADSNAASAITCSAQLYEVLG